MLLNPEELYDSIDKTDDIEVKFDANEPLDMVIQNNTPMSTLASEMSEKNLDDDIVAITAYALDANRKIDDKNITNTSNISYGEYHPMTKQDFKKTPASALATMSAVVASGASEIKSKFMEDFFPTVFGTPGSFGVNVKYSTIKEVRYNDNAGVNENPFVNVEFNKNLYNMEDDLFRTKRMHHINNATNISALIPEITKDIIVNGVTVKTSPLDIAVVTDLFRVGRTSAEVIATKQTRQNLLSNDISLDNIYIGKKNGENPATNAYAFNVVDNSASVAIGVPNGNIMDFSIGFTDQVVSMTTKDLDLITGTTTLFSNITAEYTIVISLTMNATIKSENNMISFTTAKIIPIVEINDVNGNPVDSTSSDYVSIATIINTLSIIGADIKCYDADLIKAITGKKLDIKTETLPISIAPRVGATVSRQSDKSRITNEDAEPLRLITLSNEIDKFKDGIITLDKFISVNLIKFKSKVSKSILISQLGPSAKIFDPYFDVSTIDISSIVNTYESTNDKENIKAGLEMFITTKYMAMEQNSNYIEILKTSISTPNIKPKIIIGVGKNISLFLDKEFTINGITVTVSVIPFKEKADTMYMGYGMTTDNNGNLIYSGGASYVIPTLVHFSEVRLGGDDSSGTYENITNNPCYTNKVHLPIWTKVEFTGFKELASVLSHREKTV